LLGLASEILKTPQNQLVELVSSYKISSKKPKTADLDLGFSLSPDLGKTLMIRENPN
jgi:hypothetical protein